MLKKRQQEYVLPSEHDVVLDNTPQTLYVLVKISNALLLFLFFIYKTLTPLFSRLDCQLLFNLLNGSCQKLAIE